MVGRRVEWGAMDEQVQQQNRTGEGRCWSADGGFRRRVEGGRGWWGDGDITKGEERGYRYCVDVIVRKSTRSNFITILHQYEPLRETLKLPPSLRQG